MATYQCPICQQTMNRDLLLFLSHADEHIIDAIKKKHREWVEEDGVCRKCYEHYQSRKRGEKSPCG